MLSYFKNEDFSSYKNKDIAWNGSFFKHKFKNFKS